MEKGMEKGDRKEMGKKAKEGKRERPTPAAPALTAAMAPAPQRGCATAPPRPEGRPLRPAFAMAPPPSVLCLFDVDGTLTAPRQASAGRGCEPAGSGADRALQPACEPAGSGVCRTLPPAGSVGTLNALLKDPRGAAGLHRLLRSAGAGLWQI